jgi:hypothetical protein
VGAVGLLGFIGLTGLDLVNRLKGAEAGGVVGWPLILLIGGAILLALGFVLSPEALGGRGGPSVPGQPPLDQWRQQPPPGAGPPPTQS